jgi:hypothetical protein
METLKVLSIDIGITNLGYVYSQFNIDTRFGSKYKATVYNSDYTTLMENSHKDITIIDCDRVDITKVKHRKVPLCVCKLHHDRCIPDYLDHFIQETSYFEECDVLLLERQPPVGITNVQDLLFKLFRDKVELISPNSIHKYFKLPGGEYNARKQLSEQLSSRYLLDFTTFTENIRRHDIADAMLMTIYHYKTFKSRLIENYQDPTVNQFEQFRFFKD